MKNEYCNGQVSKQLNQTSIKVTYNSITYKNNFYENAELFKRVELPERKIFPACHSAYCLSSVD